VLTPNFATKPFFACEEDISHEVPDASAPEAVASGKKLFLVVGAAADKHLIGWGVKRVKIAVLIARILLGLMFCLFGLNGFFSFLPAQMPPGVAGQFLTSLMTSHYVYLVAATQLLSGILLLINRYVVFRAGAACARDREHRDLSPDNATGDGAAGDTGDAPLDLFVLVVSGALCMSVGPEGECLSRNLHA